MVISNFNITPTPLKKSKKFTNKIKKNPKKGIICNDRAYEENAIWANFYSNVKANILSNK